MREIVLESRFGTLRYGLRPEGFDGWTFRENGGGGRETCDSSGGQRPFRSLRTPLRARQSHNFFLDSLTQKVANSRSVAGRIQNILPVFYKKGDAFLHLLSHSNELLDQKSIVVIINEFKRDCWNRPDRPQSPLLVRSLVRRKARERVWLDSLCSPSLVHKGKDRPETQTNRNGCDQCNADPHPCFHHVPPFLGFFSLPFFA